MERDAIFTLAALLLEKEIAYHFDLVIQEIVSYKAMMSLKIILKDKELLSRINVDIIYLCILHVFLNSLQDLQLCLALFMRCNECFITTLNY